MTGINDSSVWRFGDVVVDTTAHRVLVGGLEKELEPKSFRLLQFLIENRERVLSKEEIFASVWAGVVVSDNSLTRAIALIRKSIGDDPKQPRYIRTVPKVGYRFFAEVHTSTAPDSLAAEAAVSKPSIAVLPFANLSAERENEYFADGLAEEILNSLARVRELKVIARTSSFAFRGGDQDIAAIAAALRVSHVLEGSVRRAGKRIRVVAQLIATDDSSHVWSKRYDRELTDVFVIQDEISAAISAALRVSLVPPVDATRREVGTTPSVEPGAFDAYLKGRYFFNRPSDENLQTAIARFEDAIALDLNFVPALSGLSDAYLWAGYNEGFISATEARPKARAAAERAIRLDPLSAESHTSLAVFKLFYEYDWPGSEAAFRQALELNPSYAYAHDQFSVGLAFQRRFEESITENRRAAELDPLNPQIAIDACLPLIWQGDRQAAMDEAKRAENLDPTNFFPFFTCGCIEIQCGYVEDAIPHLLAAKSKGAPPFVSAWLAYAYGASRDRRKALAEAEELQRRSRNGRATAFDSALVALGLGDLARAVSLLEQAYALDSQWLGWLNNDRVFDPLRSDSRFCLLLKKLGFG